MTSNPLSGDMQEGLIGVVLGITAALGAQYGLTWRNLRWTWALLPAALGILAAAGLRSVESWSVGLAVGGLVTARWTFLLERRDREAGGDARRRAREVVGIRDALGARRVRRSRLVAQGRYLLGLDRRRRPVTIRFGGASGRHGLLVGASGSGKSNALLCCVARHVEAGFGVVVVDMKGDQLLARRLRREANRWRRLFRQWTLDGGDRWNPLARGNRSELKDKLIGTEDFTERHYQAMYERYLVNLFRALEGRPEKRNLRTVIRLLDPAALAMEVRGLDDDHAAGEIGEYLARLTPDQARDLRGLADRLALLVEGGHGDYLMPADEPHQEIDLLHAIGTGDVVLFSSTRRATGRRRDSSGTWSSRTSRRSAARSRTTPAASAPRSSPWTSSPRSTVTRSPGSSSARVPPASPS